MEHWAEPRYISVGISDPDANPAIQDALNQSPQREFQRFTSASLMAAAKEVILIVEGDHLK
jgi:hypothetical protein